MEYLKISVIVVCKNEAGNIGKCIDSICKTDYPKDHFELIIIDNASQDNTLEEVRKKQKLYSNIRLEINKKIGIASSRNLGLKLANFAYVAFTDADCFVPLNWLKVLSDGFSKYINIYPNLVAVGGSNIFAQEKNNFQKAANIVLHSFWGSHTSIQGRVFKQDMIVNHIPTVNILYKKEIVLMVGGFDEGFANICEDVELNHRLIKKRYRFVYLKDSFVWHNFASNLNEWTKKVFTYGKGRVWVIKKHPTHISLKFLIPPLFLLLLITAFLLGARCRICLIPFVYFPFIFLITIIECTKSKKLSLFPFVFVIYIFTHISYGLGEFYGAFKKRK